MQKPPKKASRLPKAPKHTQEEERGAEWQKEICGSQYVPLRLIQKILLSLTQRCRDFHKPSGHIPSLFWAVSVLLPETCAQYWEES